MVVRDGFAELLHRPGVGRMSRHVALEDTRAADFHCEEDIEHLESRCHCNQEVAGDNSSGMILDEGFSMLR